MQYFDFFRTDYYLVALIEQYNKSIENNGAESPQAKGTFAALDKHVKSLNSDNAKATELLAKIEKLEDMAKIYSNAQIKEKLASVKSEYAQCESTIKTDAVLEQFKLYNDPEFMEALESEKTEKAEENRLKREHEEAEAIKKQAAIDAEAEEVEAKIKRLKNMIGIYPSNNQMKEELEKSELRLEELKAA